MKSLKISFQITLIGVLGLIGFIIIGGIYFTSSKTQHDVQAVQLGAGESAGLAAEIASDLTNARLQEQQFLNSRDLKYVEEHKAILAEVTPQLDELKAFHDEPKMLDLIEEIKADFAIYAEQFYEVVDNWQEIGLTPNDGLMAEMSAAADKVEEVLEANSAAVLDEHLAQMRRNEKDFLLTKNPKHLPVMEEIMVAFDKQLAVTTAVPAGMKDTVEADFDVYMEKFKRIYTLILEVEQDEIRMGELYDEVYPQIVLLLEDSAADTNDAVAALEANQTSTFNLMMSAMAIITVISFTTALLVGRGISRPIGNMTDAMTTLADGNLEIEVPAQDYGNELGQMAAAVQVFKENAIEVKRMQAEQQANEERAAKEKRDLMLKMADDFENSVGGVVNSVSSASTEMQSSATALSATAEQTSNQATTVAAAAEEASTNVQTVASASEELSSSISEISRQVAQSTQIASTAVTEVDGANAKVQGLAEAAQKIGEVVALITDIADQTNLLALNATIEAARAGDAGKGFAVVASEVKNLANQTAKATEEISSQIGGIQGATQDAVEAIGSIGGIINQMNEIASTIASAVEEQGAATQEIARNVEQAAAGTSEVSSNIAGVQDAAGETGSSAGDLLGAAKELSMQSETLRGEVDTFLANIRKG